MRTEHTIANYASQLVFCDLEIGDVFTFGTKTLLRVPTTATNSGTAFNSVIMSTGTFFYCGSNDPVSLATEVKVFL